MATSGTFRLPKEVLGSGRDCRRVRQLGTFCRRFYSELSSHSLSNKIGQHRMPTNALKIETVKWRCVHDRSRHAEGHEEDRGGSGRHIVQVYESRNLIHANNISHGIAVVTGRQSGHTITPPVNPPHPRRTCICEAHRPADPVGRACGDGLHCQWQETRKPKNPLAEFTVTTSCSRSSSRTWPRTLALSTVTVRARRVGIIPSKGIRC